MVWCVVSMMCWEGVNALWWVVGAQRYSSGACEPGSPGGSHVVRPRGEEDCNSRAHGNAWACVHSAHQWVAEQVGGDGCSTVEQCAIAGINCR